MQGPLGHVDECLDLFTSLLVEPRDRLRQLRLELPVVADNEIEYIAHSECSLQHLALHFLVVFLHLDEVVVVRAVAADASHLQAHAVEQKLDGFQASLELAQSTVTHKHVDHLEDLQLCVKRNALGTIGCASPVELAVEHLTLNRVDEAHAVHEVLLDHLAALVSQEVAPREDLQFAVPDDKLLDSIRLLIARVQLLARISIPLV